MAITNYGELKTAVQDWLERSDLSGYAADYITLVQGEMNLRLRCRQMVTTATLSPTSGVFTLPSTYLQYISVVEDASFRNVLEYLALEEAEEIYPDRPGGLGVHFTISGTDLRVYPTISNDIFLTHYQTFTAFSADGDTDWVLTSYPHVYLRGARAFAYDFTRSRMMDREFSLFYDAIDKLNGQDDASELAGAAMHIQGATP